MLVFGKIPIGYFGHVHFQLGSFLLTLLFLTYLLSLFFSLYKIYIKIIEKKKEVLNRGNKEGKRTESVKEMDRLRKESVPPPGITGENYRSNEHLQDWGFYTNFLRPSQSLGARLFGGEP
jgi:hypothetical protein